MMRPVALDVDGARPQLVARLVHRDAQLAVDRVAAAADAGDQRSGHPQLDQVGLEADDLAADVAEDRLAARERRDHRRAVVQVVAEVDAGLRDARPAGRGRRRARTAPASSVAPGPQPGRSSPRSRPIGAAATRPAGSPRRAARAASRAPRPVRRGGRPRPSASRRPAGGRDARRSCHALRARRRFAHQRVPPPGEHLAAVVATLRQRDRDAARVEHEADGTAGHVCLDARRAPRRAETDAGRGLDDDLGLLARARARRRGAGRCGPRSAPGSASRSDAR